MYLTATDKIASGLMNEKNKLEKQVKKEKNYGKTHSSNLISNFINISMPDCCIL